MKSNKDLEKNMLSYKKVFFEMLPILILFLGAAVVLLASYSVVYGPPRTKVEARQHILEQFPDCEGKIEENIKNISNTYPNSGGWNFDLNYLVCEFHDLEVRYILDHSR